MRRRAARLRRETSSPGHGQGQPASIYRRLVDKADLRLVHASLYTAAPAIVPITISTSPPSEVYPVR